MFSLTRGEVAAMSAASGLSPDQFSVQDQADDAFLEFLAALHPAFLMTMPGGRRRRLIITPQGACLFLGPQGCALPQEARPLYCRLYPFWINPHGRLMVLANPQCLAQQNARSWREALKRLGQDEPSLRALFARFLELAADNERAGGKLS